MLSAIAIFISSARADAREFYDGKTIRIVVGYAPGGGYDFYARLLARYMGKYIPGNPAFVVENMPGAGSLAAANYLYKLVKPDGLTGLRREARVRSMSSAVDSRRCSLRIGGHRSY
jgi:tripartite-type tricarboxylate transporter receptor subunit TctC